VGVFLHIFFAGTFVGPHPAARHEITLMRPGEVADYAYFSEKIIFENMSANLSAGSILNY
jgi:hypothetical protein